ncbi:Metallo-dependent hydrolase [Sodiomyces alkalinus F11]|uniref:Metallo-dependent hydrolase n=1 Tax=Sodiomyces alkalinus (strain CBS 110278 / VKM F-3762 / F11) TaxID=1314773 RepID=A0A3N2PUJ7_SODAK|nr:Metallo-dependent hydrolase [Sodiomyces alkalinus F11]ROT38171.1 Metallo-dependent hydrolase [Sodiomyces alkalinus F11]
MPEGKHDYNLKTFFPLFSTYIYALITDAASLSYATQAVLRDFAADGVRYLELRTTPRATCNPTDGSERLSRESYVRTVLAAITSYEKNDTDRRDQDTLRTKLILSIDRRDDLPTATETVRLAARLRDEEEDQDQDHPETRGLVVGVDLCGDPTARTALDPSPRGGVAELTPAFAEARKRGLHVAVHFAESEASGTDEELVTLLSWRPGRLGHVIWLSDRVKELVRRRGECGEEEEEEEGGIRGIGLELCLSCNVLAGMTKGPLAGFAGHHFGEWWGAKGCWVSLGTDDVGVFGSPLSNEYRLAAEHFNLSNAQVCELASLGIESIFGGEEEKARLRRIMWTSA